MDILTALLRIRQIQESISVADPTQQGETLKIVKAWLTRPPANVVLTEFPCFINTWNLGSETRRSGLRQQEYTVNMQLVIKNSDWDVSALMATAFMPAIVDAFDANVTLGARVVRTALRGGRPTLAKIVLDQVYVGLDLYLDLYMGEGHEFEAGVT